MRPDIMLPIHLAPGNGGIQSTDRGEETAPPSHSEPPFQHHDRHIPSGLTLIANSSQTATSDADAGEQHGKARVTQSDWSIHRETIIYLYRDCMQPLHQVRETMEREYGFFATERMYKHRFKQWRMFKYAKQGGKGQRHRNQDDKATQLHTSEALVRRPETAYPATVATPPRLPDGLRDLEVCMKHLHSFIIATCGDSKKRPRTVDPSPEMALSRSSWGFSVSNAVLQIHQGRLTAGFRLLDTAFIEFRRNIDARDTGFLFRLVAPLCLFADDGLPGLLAIFLQYAHHALCLELSPDHPLSMVTRYIQTTVVKDGMHAAWDVVGRYSELLWESSDPNPAGPLPSEPIPVLADLAWDLSRSVDRDFVSPLAAPSQTLGWASSHLSTYIAVAQAQLTQRLYGAARRVVNDLLAHLDPAAESLDVALAYRKRWQISRAEGRHAKSCADARTYIDFCRASLGPDHYMTVRAVHEYGDYLSGWRAANPLEIGPGPDPLSENLILPPETNPSDMGAGTGPFTENIILPVEPEE